MYKQDELSALRQQVARKAQLEIRVEQLRAQRRELARKAEDLKAAQQEEQADVDRLEGRSLAAFFYAFTGKMEEKLDEERREAYAARVKYDAAARELSAVEGDLARDEAELRRMSGCEAAYRQALEGKAAALRAAGDPAAGEITHLEEEMAAAEREHKELQEAIEAGYSAQDWADRILEQLNSAENWAIWDMMGGDLIADLAKHDRLDQAQEMVEQLQVELRRFKTELTDVSIDAEMQVKLDGFLRFADYFFDGLFADWAVMDHIENSQKQVSQTRQQVEEVLASLESRRDAVERHYNALAQKREEQIFAAEPAKD